MCCVTAVSNSGEPQASCHFPCGKRVYCVVSRVWGPQEQQNERKQNITTHVVGGHARRSKTVPRGEVLEVAVYCLWRSSFILGRGNSPRMAYQAGHLLHFLCQKGDDQTEKVLPPTMLTRYLEERCVPRADYPITFDAQVWAAAIIDYVQPQREMMYSTMLQKDVKIFLNNRFGVVLPAKAIKTIHAAILAANVENTMELDLDFVDDDFHVIDGTAAEMFPFVNVNVVGVGEAGQQEQLVAEDTEDEGSDYDDENAVEAGY